ncbi:MAG TPA: acylphosphatase [Thermomicrobiaceae bacterium]|nr:acylphosphatase [Thermomicrobiaceae bacterium]
MSAGGRIMEQRTCLVSGRVQGVGFRAFVVEAAAALGLRGWVRNEEDGRSLSVVAEGPVPALDALETRLRVGPPGALVERVACRSQRAAGLDAGFVVRR